MVETGGERRGLIRRWLIGVVLLATAALPFVQVAIVLPLSPAEQAEVSLVMLAVALAASRFQTLRPMIIFLSCFASMRYFYWRIAWTLNLSSPIDAAASIALLAAETYGVLILFLGYFQSLEAPARAPAPPRATRSVDVLIPTYNEPEAIVRRTVIGALAMTYARKRVFVLDDARRPEIEALAAEWKGKITVNAVLPSIIDTAANRASMPNADFSKWVAPRELADVILFLASEAASSITGALIPVPGRV